MGAAAGVCTLALLGSSASAGTDADGLAGTTNCNPIRHAVLHVISRGAVGFSIDGSDGDFANHKYLTRDDLAGGINRTHWFWWAQSRYSWEMTPTDYYISDAWTTCEFD